MGEWSRGANGTRRVPGLRQASLAGDGFWRRWRDVHAGPALEHQWRCLEETHAIECFRIAGGASDAFRSGEFYTDSDVLKWLEAASRHLVDDPPAQTVARVDELIGLLEAAQAADGYLNTWVQVLFPGGRFRNLDIEHEMYTFGHLIEAGVSHHEATGSHRLLDVAVKAADLLVREFADAPPHRLDGHEEIELALVRLYRATGVPAYLDLASAFVERRGTTPHFNRRFRSSVALTVSRHVRQRVGEALHRLRRRGRQARQYPEKRSLHVTPAIVRRVRREMSTGRMFQTDRPVRQQDVPTGHSVRWLYLHIAMAMLARELDDDSLRVVGERAWDQFVEGHLFVNGGSGAFPLVEGFGDPYDLDPERAYAETRASIAGVLWNRELGLLTGDAGYDDLLEWQLLNGADVGMGVDGRTYAYDNPLWVPVGAGRQEWFRCPCCPSNLSRTWASLATLQFSWTDDEVRLHQLFSSRAQLGATAVEVESALPWSGEVVVRLMPAVDGSGPQRLTVRVPSWADEVEVEMDGVGASPLLDGRPAGRVTASGLDPAQSTWCHIDLPAGHACEVRLRFTLPVRFLRQDVRVPRVGGRVAVARGPLLYCLEGVDHAGLAPGTLHDLTLGPEPLTTRFDPDLLGGAVDLRGRAADGRALRFVPYFLWGNRGATGMTVFVHP